MANFTGDVVAMAQREGFNPWSLPESFTLYNYAPDDIKSFLHPHWHSMKALHPMWYYVIGLVYLVVGKSMLRWLSNWVQKKVAEFDDICCLVF